MIRAIALVLRLWVQHPDQPIDRVVLATYHALRAETERVPAEVMLAIAHHESDLRPNAVSFVRAGKRVDVLWDGAAPLPPRVVCGYLQAMASPAECRAMVTHDGGMLAGSLELRTWSGTCRGDLACVLRGHAGGTACSRDAGACTSHARAFAALFLARARRLGYSVSLNRATSSRSSARLPPIASGS